MTKTIKQIEKEIKEDNLIDDLISPCWESRKVELKELEDSLIEEITKKEPEWVKERRLEYLKLRLDMLNKEYLKRHGEIQEYRTRVDSKDNMSLYGVYNLFADLMEYENNTNKRWVESFKTPWRGKKIKILKFLPDIAKEIDKIHFEIRCWENPGIDYDAGNFTESAIETARNADPSRFIEFEGCGNSRYRAKCPFHNNGNERTPSFYWFEDSKKLYCFSCSWSGNTVDLIMRLYNTDFKSAVGIILNK